MLDLGRLVGCKDCQLNVAESPKDGQEIHVKQLANTGHKDCCGLHDAAKDGCIYWLGNLAMKGAWVGSLESSA